MASLLDLLEDRSSLARISAETATLKPFAELPKRFWMDTKAKSKKILLSQEFEKLEIPSWAHSIAKSLLQSLKERDPYTYGHCRRVARNARLFAAALGLSETDQTLLEFGSMFHDLGKMGIPDRILFKPGKLNAEEEAIMRSHPQRSADIVGPLSQIPFFRATLPGIRHHHERMDGKGYPYGLSGDAIPLHARIMLIVDTFDAMTTTRPYRKGLPLEVAFQELKIFSGRQFDAQLVKIFLEAYPKWDALDEEITEEFVASQFRRAA